MPSRSHIVWVRREILPWPYCRLAAIPRWDDVLRELRRLRVTVKTEWEVEGV